MESQRKAQASWKGDLKNGQGQTSTESGALRDVAMKFGGRFASEGGSNPEELIAAAHATCFNMALANVLGEQGHAPKALRTSAAVTLRLGEGGPKITAVHLETEGEVPGIDEAAFREAAEGAKKNCPVSKLLTPGLEKVTLAARLKT